MQRVSVALRFTLCSNLVEQNSLKGFSAVDTRKSFATPLAAIRNFVVGVFCLYTGSIIEITGAKGYK